MHGKNIIERAFELASFGEVENLRQLESVLRKEGFEAAAQHLSGASLRKDLRTRIEKRRAAQQDLQPHPLIAQAG